jgi:hypothetical protein
LVAAGCLYVEPAWSPDVNLPPEILFPDPDVEQVFDLNQISQVFVTVREPDTDRIVFQWSVPDVAQAQIIDTPQGNNEWTSSLRIMNKAAILDGQTIRCTVVDEASPANRREVSWALVLEAP